MNKTIFYQKHIKHEGKIVDFAGWQMPINYPSGIIKESNFVRENSGFFDVSHMGRIEVIGKNSENFIEKLLPINMSSFKNESAKYTLLINNKNEILDDLIAYKISNEKFLLVINASNTEEDLKWINSIKTSEKINNITHKTGMLAVQGPKAIEKINNITHNAVAELGRYKFKNIKINEASVFVARTGYTGEDGVEIIFDNRDGNKIWESLLSLNIEPCGLGARDLLRIEAGLHLYGHEINKNSNPIDINLSRLLETKSENYINSNYINGKEIRLGTQSIAGFKVLDRGIPREGNEIYLNENIIGKITSGTHSPRINSSIAIGLIDKEFNKIENKVKIKVRNRYLEAEIIMLPFYRRKRK